MTIHDLRIIDILFKRILDGRMPFVIAKAITPAGASYIEGDVLRVFEMDIYSEYSGRSLQVQITHIAPSGRTGLQEGFTVLGFVPYHAHG